VVSDHCYHPAWPIPSPAMGHWGTCLPLDFQLIRAAQSLTATLCGCLSKHIVFCDTSCGSSVAATWTLFTVLFRVILCATKISCSFVSPLSHKILATPLIPSTVCTYCWDVLLVDRSAIATNSLPGWQRYLTNWWPLYSLAITHHLVI